MTKTKRDPLLTSARYIVGGLIGLFCLVGVALAMGMVAALSFRRQNIFDQLVAKGIPSEGYIVILLVMICALVTMVLIVFFLRELYRIVRSVRDGDPFIPVNADRLRTMGWLALASQPLLWAMGGAGAWLHQFSKAAIPHEDFSFTGGGLLLALVLFVLARVFRIGTDMREELEGTV